MQGQRDIIGGIMRGGAGSMFGMAEGGMVSKPAMSSPGPQSRLGKMLAMAEGGGVDPTIGSGAINNSSVSVDQSANKKLKGGIEGLFDKSDSTSSESGSSMASSSGMMRPMAGMAKGGTVPALVSPGEKYLSPQAVQQVKQGANPMSVGESIPGKPKISGAKNSYVNDVVKKDLKEGGIVIPRSVTQSKDADKKADEFVRHVLGKNKLKKKL
jgi:hypothetical protein